MGSRVLARVCAKRMKWWLNGNGYQKVRLQGQGHGRGMGVKQKKCGFGS